MNTKIHTKNHESRGWAKGVIVNIMGNHESEHPKKNVIILTGFATADKNNSSIKEETLNSWTANDYYMNKFGDEYAYTDDLGFEVSCMGPYADYNHIFQETE